MNSPQLFSAPAPAPAHFLLVTLAVRLLWLTPLSSEQRPPATVLPSAFEPWLSGLSDEVCYDERTASEITFKLVGCRSYNCNAKTLSASNVNCFNIFCTDIFMLSIQYTVLFIYLLDEDRAKA